MRKQVIPQFLPRILALFLSISCALPNPVFALRQTGLEENSARQEFLNRITEPQVIQVTAGMEEGWLNIPDLRMAVWRLVMQLDKEGTRVLDTYVTHDPESFGQSMSSATGNILLLNQVATTLDGLNRLFGKIEFVERVSKIINKRESEAVAKALGSKRRSPFRGLQGKLDYKEGKLTILIRIKPPKNMSTGLEEKKVAGDIVAGRFRDAIREALGGSDLASVVLGGRGVVLHAGIGTGILALAAGLEEVQVPVVVVEPDPQKRQADARLLVDIPVTAGMEEAVQILAARHVEPLILTPAVTSTPAAALAYLQQLRLLPRGNLQPILAVGLEEGRFERQMGNYL